MHLWEQSFHGGQASACRNTQSSKSHIRRAFVQGAVAQRGQQPKAAHVEAKLQSDLFYILQMAVKILHLRSLRHFCIGHHLHELRANNDCNSKDQEKYQSHRPRPPLVCFVCLALILPWTLKCSPLCICCTTWGYLLGFAAVHWAQC